MGLSAIAAPVLGADKLTVAFADAKWNGKRIPDGQHCEKFGGKGATPALKVSGIPKGTGAIRVEINDASYRPLSYDGGHGVVGFKYSGNGEVVLPPVAGGTNKTPKGTWIERENCATGEWSSPGYLPPCSGGRGNTYFAVVKAVDSNEKVLAKAESELGRY